jgi:hypothetical protein
MGLVALANPYANADFIPRTVTKIKKDTQMVRAPGYHNFFYPDMLSLTHQRIGITLYMLLTAYLTADQYF